MKKSFMKRLVALALVIVSVFSMSAVALAETGLPVGSTAYTIKGDVAVRSSAGGSIISRVDTGTAVTILQTTNTTNGWYRVRVDGLTSSGYIREDCLGANAIGAETTINRYMYCKVDEGEYVNIRSGPSKSYSSIGELRRGDMVYVVSADATWAKINAPINGYVMIEFLQYDDVEGGGNYDRPTSAAEAFGSSGIIQQGNFGYKVANVQLALGFAQSEIDAIFGPDTYAAVVDFQSKNGLEPDGKVGPLTKEALWNAAETRLRNFGYTTW